MKKLNIIVMLAIFFVASSAFISVKEVYKIDVSASSVKWTGYHLAKSYDHWGNVTIKSGSLDLDGEKLVGGEFVIDMTSLTNGDLEKEKDNAKLVKHLKSGDFFGVDKFPVATLNIKSATNSGNNYSVTADLTIRNIKKEITFDATRSDADGNVNFSASLSVDRTAHEVMYGWKVENAVLSNEFKLDINLVATK